MSSSQPGSATALARPTFLSSLSSLRGAQKPAYGTPAYSRFVNRPLGRLVAAAVHSVGMTPNQATAISAVLSGTGIALIALAPRGPLVGVAVALCLALGYVMDSVDGQLARLRGAGSRSGEWLDHTVDCFKTSTLHLAVLVSWYRDPVGAEATLLLPVVFVVVATAWYFELILLPTLRPRDGRSTSPRSEHPLRKWALLPVDYGTVCLAFVLLGWDTGFLAVYALLLLAALAVLVQALGKWWRELRALDADQEPGPVDQDRSAP
jgi:phosphatidylglycerophosphate synthase